MKRTILAPFLALIFLGFILAWGVYVIGSRMAVLETADHMARESASRIQDRLEAYLGNAAQIALVNAAYVAGVPTGAGSSSDLCRAFRAQLLDSASVDILSAGFADGEYSEAQRLAPDHVRIGSAGASTGGALVLRSVGNDGSPGEVELRRPGYDPRTRPWYLAAAAAGGLAWTEPYSIVSTGELTTAAVVPVYGAGRLKAVVSANLPLGALSGFLASITREGGGMAFVVDPMGRVIASSLPGQGSEATASIIAAAATADRPARVEVGGIAHRGFAMPFSAPGGLSWNVLVALPESTFLAPLAAVDLRAALILLAMLVGVVVVAFATANRIAGPLHLLSEAVARLDLGAPSPQASDSSLGGLVGREDEIGRLARAFRELRVRLDESFVSLRASLTEKEVLLKEVHHRVKNNLQIVSSLVSLQAGYACEEAAREGLDQLQDRVQTMALVHEDAYGCGDFSSVRMDAYLQRLCESLSSYRRLGNRVTLEVEVSDISVTLDKALLCGLVVGELVTNSFKHAFVGRDSGKVVLRLTREGDAYRIAVRDDGIGLHPSSASSPRPGIGTSIVEGLALQLRGRIETFSGAEGTTKVLIFPAK